MERVPDRYDIVASLLLKMRIVKRVNVVEPTGRSGKVGESREVFVECMLPNLVNVGDMRSPNLLVPLISCHFGR